MEGLRGSEERFRGKSAVCMRKEVWRGRGMKHGAMRGLVGGGELGLEWEEEEQRTSWNINGKRGMKRNNCRVNQKMMRANMRGSVRFAYPRLFFMSMTSIFLVAD